MNICYQLPVVVEEPLGEKYVMRTNRVSVPQTTLDCTNAGGSPPFHFIPCLIREDLFLWMKKLSYYP